MIGRISRISNKRLCSLCSLLDLLPNARLVSLPGVGHMLQHARPDAVMAAVDELARRDAGGARYSAARSQITPL